MGNPLVILAFVILGLLGFVIAIIVLACIPIGLKFINLWVHAKSAGVNCSITRMIGMRLRRVDAQYVIENMISLHNAGVPSTLDEFENHILAGGRLEDAVEAMISANKAGLDVTFPKICAIDLAGRDVVRAIDSCVEPITIDIPSRNSGQKYIMGVAKDGIQLGVNVKVTAKADIHRLVGGANERTIAARVGEGIVSTIGSADTHKAILENPGQIANKILSRGLDANTAFSIVSVDIGDVEVLDNIGAKLQQDQADADQMIAQARAESRRAMAQAVNRENTAKIREMRAVETLNKSEVPKDMARSYQRGNIFRSPKPVHSVIKRKLWEA